MPRSATRHVAVDNLSFVLNLRKEENIDKPRPKSAIPAINQKKGSEEDEKKIFKEQSKETGCKNSQCLLVEAELVEVLNEKREITDSLMDLSRTFAVDEQFYNEMTQEYSETITRQEDLLRKLMALDVDFSKKVEMLQKLKEEQQHLEDQIARKHAELRGLAESKETKKNEIIPKDHCRKHNGVYVATRTGRPHWSCCLAEDEHADGCIDDQSIGIKSKLGHVKNFFHNYIKAPVIGSTSVWKETSSALPPHFKSTFRSSQEFQRNPSQVSFRPNSSRHLSKLNQNSASIHHNHSSAHLPHSDSLHTNTWISNHERSEMRGNASNRRRASFTNVNTVTISQHNETHNLSVMVTTKDSIGKVRPSSSSRLAGNRPMSSPGGFQLYQHS